MLKPLEEQYANSLAAFGEAVTAAAEAIRKGEVPAKDVIDTIDSYGIETEAPDSGACKALHSALADYGKAIDAIDAANASENTTDAEDGTEQH